MARYAASSVQKWHAASVVVVVVVVATRDVLDVLAVLVVVTHVSPCGMRLFEQKP
jgi:hypothetical protein